jgi:aspartyl/asparaginyl-tRNA synthetase
MKNTQNYHVMMRKLRQFFQEEKGFIEVPAQSRLSILAACEDPKNITQYYIAGDIYPLPQTGQMWLEYELLKNPSWPGVFCCTTSYRDEPQLMPNRHHRIFPMFEFESHGSIDQLRTLETELLHFLGFSLPKSIGYEDACRRYSTEFINAAEEELLQQDNGNSLMLEYFPERTSPFWNMRRSERGAHKIDVILHGMETIGSAERSTDAQQMYQNFSTISDGAYAQLLFDRFGKDRVQKELDEFLSLPMIERFGAGIGITRLERAMALEGLLEPAPFYAQPARLTQTFA